jgi:hypothetical protein
MSDETNGFSSGWVLGGIATILGVMSGVISLLYKVRESENAKRIDEQAKRIDTLTIKADKCDEDRIALHRADAANKERISIMEDMLKEIHPNWKSREDLK